MQRRTFALLCVLLLLSFTTLCGASKILKKPTSVPGTMKVDESETKLPPRNSHALHCSACRSSAKVLSHHLDNAMIEFKNLNQEQLQKKLKLYHLLSAVEGVCSTEKLNVGLRKRSHTAVVLPIFEHETLGPEHTSLESQRGEKDSYMVKGSWITKLWEDACHKLQADVEDDLLEVALGRQSADNWCDKTCDRSKKRRKYVEEEEEDEEDL